MMQPRRVWALALYSAEPPGSNQHLHGQLDECLVSMFSESSLIEAKGHSLILDCRLLGGPSP